MTLILTALTPKYAVQVSDRRVSWDTPSGVKSRDGFVKAIVTPTFACSYTGVAELDTRDPKLGRDTAIWTALRLAEAYDEPDAGIESLGAALTEEFRNPRYAGHTHEVPIVGWMKGESVMVPVAFVVTNVERSTRQATMPFYLQRVTPKPGRLSAVHRAGQPLSRDELVRVNRTVEDLCESGRATPRAVAQVLTELIRSVSRGTDDRAVRVSENTLVICKPRPDLLRGNLVVGQLVDDYISVTNIQKGESRTEKHGGPIIVGRNAAVQALPPDDGPPGVGLSASARILRKPGPGSAINVVLLTNPPLGAAWGWPGAPLRGSEAAR